MTWVFTAAHKMILENRSELVRPPFLGRANEIIATISLTLPDDNSIKYTAERKYKKPVQSSTEPWVVKQLDRKIGRSLRSPCRILVALSVN